LRGLVYLAREEILAGTEYAVQTFLSAERESKQFHLTQELNILFNKLRFRIQTDSNHLNIFNKIHSSIKTDRKL
jgi:hypothetical protein